MQTNQEYTGFALMAELQNYERQGISIWLDGSPSTPDSVYEALRLRESFSFMRDFIFFEGELMEIRFDRID